MAEKVYLKDHIQEMIRQKYAPVSKLGADNTIVHQIFNYIDEDQAKEIHENNGAIFNPNLLLLQEEFNELSVNKYKNVATYGVSDWLQSKGMKKIVKYAGLDWAVKELPFSSLALKEKMKEIKNKDIDLVVIGYGGAMSNVLWNLITLVLNFSDFNSPFRSISIYEKDELSFTNILRFGKPIIHKAFSNFDLPDDDVLPKFQVMDWEHQLSSEVQKVQKFLNAKEAKKLIEELNNPVFIGAPDFETRKFLQEIEAPFFFIGHGDNEVTITNKPNIHFAVQETYGTIDIPVLLVNLWLATYKLIDILSNKDYGVYEVNEEIWKFNFDLLTSRQINAIKKAFTELVD